MLKKTKDVLILSGLVLCAVPIFNFLISLFIAGLFTASFKIWFHVFKNLTLVDIFLNTLAIIYGLALIVSGNMIKHKSVEGVGNPKILFDYHKKNRSVWRGLQTFHIAIMAFYTVLSFVKWNHAHRPGPIFFDWYYFYGSLTLTLSAGVIVYSFFRGKISKLNLFFNSLNFENQAFSLGSSLENLRYPIENPQVENFYKKNKKSKIKNNKKNETPVDL